MAPSCPRASTLRSGRPRSAGVGSAVAVTIRLPTSFAKCEIWYTGTVLVDRLQRLVSVECVSVADVIHTALQDRVAVRELIARRAARACQGDFLRALNR